jgi:hypothetical protein
MLISLHLSKLHLKLQEEELDMYKWQSLTMGNIVPTFADVIRQVWDSLIHWHTIDIKWKYNRKGF